MSELKRRKTAVAVAEFVAGPKTIVKGKKAKRAKNNAKQLIPKKSAPVNTDFRYRNLIPKTIGLKNGVRIKHTEFIGDVQAHSVANNTHVTPYNLNPAASTTFPWLSIQAKGYSMCIPHNIEFHYMSGVATSRDGVVFAASTPDVADDTPSTKSEILRLENSTRSQVWSNLTYRVPQDTLRRLPEYLTSSNIAHPVDSTREIGRFYLGICMPEASVVAGELYVTYDITLQHPQDALADSVVGYTTTPTVGYLFAGMDYTTAYAGGKSTMKVTNTNITGVASNDWIKVEKAGHYMITVIAVGTGLGTFNSLQVRGDHSTILTNSVPCNIVNSTSTAANCTILVFHATAPWFLTLGISGTLSSVTLFITSVSPDLQTEPESVASRCMALERRLNSLQVKVDELDDEPIHTEHSPTNSLHESVHISRDLAFELTKLIPSKRD